MMTGEQPFMSVHASNLRSHEASDAELTELGGLSDWGLQHERPPR